MKTAIKQRFYFKSIYTKLFLLFFITGVLPLILASLYAYYNGREALLNSAIRLQEIEVTTGMRNIVTLFVESNTHIRLTAQNAAFVRYFEEPQEKAIYLREQERALLYLTSLHSDLIESAVFSDINGKVISAVYNGKPVPPEEIKDMDTSGHPFFKEALKFTDNVVYHGPPEFSKLSQKWVIPFSAPISGREGAQWGILYIQIYLDSIPRLIRGVARPEDIVLVVNRQGQLITYKKESGEIFSKAYGPNDHPSYQSAIQHMMSGEDGGMWVVYDGEPHYITYRDIPGENGNEDRWSIGVMTPAKTIYSGVSTNRYLMFVLSVSSAIFAIAWIIGWGISHPLRELTSTSIAMSKGDLASRVQIRDRGDEIGQLALAFNMMAGSIQSSHEELIKLSTIDGLTGLYNHREFQKRLEEEVNRAYRYGSTLSLLMIDIDNFKKFNDTYGHQAGDTVLKAIGTIILQEIRKSDFAARYGGEEISIILPETASAEAFPFSDRLREIIHNLPITILEKEVVYISVSIGIASFPEDAANRRDLIDAADKALYFAKDKGRNKTIVYSESLRVPPEKEPAEVEDVLEHTEEWIFKDLAGSIEDKLSFQRGRLEPITHAALRIAEALHLNDEEIRDLRIATMLHDIGMANISSRILHKPEPLSAEDWKIIKAHPKMAVNLLGKFFNMQNVLPAILHHHERYDGAGYPSGLKGHEIPLLARIVGVVDAYYAMTSITPYHQRMAQEEAINTLRSHAGAQFDPRIVEVFIKTLMGGDGGPPASGDEAVLKGDPT
ncbi:MAG: diguanylate cyclase [Nitrospirae bacterium]|nr:diguanylate cyclase [Nitrospirota bacterium]